MQGKKDYWEFIVADDRTWTWCHVDGGINCASHPFPGLGAAIAHATTEGFKPENHFWKVTTQGRTTHFRPGMTAVNVPSDETPPD